MTRRTTRREDARFIAERLQDATRNWQIGDACLPFKGTEPTTVSAVNGPIVTLANGQEGHVSKMRRVR